MVTDSDSLAFSVWGIGGGAVWTHRDADRDLMDINGDGLADYVTRSPGGAFIVQINLGDHFDTPQSWAAAPWPGVPDSPSTPGSPASRTFDVGHDVLTADDGLTGQGSIGVGGVVPLFFVCIGWVAHVSSPVGANYGRLFWADMDGDGHVDQVLQISGSNSLLVRLNPTGEANLLRAIHHPLDPSGESIGIEYAHQPAVVDPTSLAPAAMAHSPWVLSRTTWNDGMGNSYSESYSYDRGNYDRVEREFYGFDTVTMTRSDGSTVSTKYMNGDYYHRGLPTSVIESDASGAILREADTVYASSTTTLSPRSGTFFPSTTSHTTIAYEGSVAGVPGPSVSTEVDYTQYDAYGHVTSEHDQGDVGLADDLYYTVEYAPPDLANYVFHPSHVVVANQPGAGAPILRERKATFYPSTGALWTVQDTVAGGRQPGDGTPYPAGTVASSSFAYDAFGNVIHYVDPLGFWIDYTYDALVTSYRASTTDAFGYVSTATPDVRFGVYTDRVDIHGQHEQTVLDPYGRITDVYGPNEYGGPHATIHYDYGLMPSTTVPRPLWAEASELDTAHPGDPIVSVVFVDGLERTVQIKHDAEIDSHAPDSSPTHTTVGMTVSGALTFDSRGRVATRGLSGFDSTSPPTAYVGLPAGLFTTTLYDTLSRPTSVDVPDDTCQASCSSSGGPSTCFVCAGGVTGHAITTFGYSIATTGGANRSVTTSTDPLGRVHATVGDVRGRTLAVQEQNTIGGTLQTLTTQYTYDALGELTKVVDATGLNQTTAEFDTLGRRIAVTSPDMGRTEYLFDLGGNLGARETANLRAAGTLIHYPHTFNRLDGITYPAGSSSTNAVFTYGAPSDPPNQRGRLTVRDDESGRETLTYGNIGEVVQSDRTIHGLAGEVLLSATTQFAYDSLNRLRTLTYPDHEVLTYTYDAGGQLNGASGLRAGATTPTSYISSLWYTAFGARSQILYGNGVASRYSYNDTTRRLQLLETAQLASGGTLEHVTYTYDPLANIVETANEPAGLPGETVYQAFTYDGLNQLTAAMGLDRMGSGMKREYTASLAYDVIGNITSNIQNDSSGPDDSHQTPVPLTSHSWTYTYGGTRPHAPTQVGTRLPSYDLDGNQTGWTDGDTHRVITWNEEDRVTSVANNGDPPVLRSLYDANGDRSVKVDADGSTTAYVNQFVTFTNAESGAPTATQHVFAGDARIESAVTATDGTRLQYFYHSNQVASTQWVTDAAGQVVEHNEYFPFGETWIDEGPTGGAGDVRYLFTGKELDAETGLYYFGARYYDAQRAQWISGDPILASYMSGEPNGGVFRPANVGLYTYSWNRPLSVRDPDGRAGVILAWSSNGVKEAPHNGIVLIDPDTGHTRYYDYGPYGTNFVVPVAGWSTGIGRGAVRELATSDVVMDKMTGMPTPESLANVLDQVQRFVSPYENEPITASYVAEINADTVRNAIYGETGNSTPGPLTSGDGHRVHFLGGWGHATWLPGVHDCHTFVESAIDHGLPYNLGSMVPRASVAGNRVVDSLTAVGHPRLLMGAPPARVGTRAVDRLRIQR